MRAGRPRSSNRESRLNSQNRESAGQRQHRQGSARQRRSHDPSGKPRQNHGPNGKPRQSHGSNGKPRQSHGSNARQLRRHGKERLRLRARKRAREVRTGIAGGENASRYLAWALATARPCATPRVKRTRSAHSYCADRRSPNAALRSAFFRQSAMRKPCAQTCLTLVGTRTSCTGFPYLRPGSPLPRHKVRRANC